MAKAKQCDICGVMYKIYGDRTDEPYTNTLTLYRRTVDNRVILGSGYKYDCCKKCMSTILDTIEMLKKENSNE